MNNSAKLVGKPIHRRFVNAKNYAADKDLPYSLEPVLDCVIEYELHGTDYVLQYNFDAAFEMLKYVLEEF